MGCGLGQAGVEGEAGVGMIGRNAFLINLINVRLVNRSFVRLPPLCKTGRVHIHLVAMGRWWWMVVDGDRGWLVVERSTKIVIYKIIYYSNYAIHIR